ncbi:MAG: excinuclease ABC subunit UvrA [Bacteroidales bacterium]|nr:excinuclease ABC subunit UvrA [Bacteroidales bacterium]HOY39858.1 excinuclease ABC subunit UvrA [Bacteroidales bacterium]HQP04852.1 excinuclease ABC subunit UvrA [Bacteroidales bacterium]
MTETESIEIFGAKVHNLNNIDLQIPRNKLVVITGLSGSGKSSLAFDTIYAEGQRRYLETFSAYARQFIGNLERPEVDKITGLSPVISIEQKTTVKNPRSTVGTITEIYDYLRLLYARASIAYSYNTGEEMVRYTDEQIIQNIIHSYSGKPVYVLAPLVDGRKGHYRELFESLRKKGFLNARIDGKVQEISHSLKLERYKSHFIELVIDKLIPDNKDHKRLKSSIETAMKFGKGIIMILEKDGTDARYFSKFLMCPTTGVSYNEPAPHNFSFNSPLGACPNCNGLGWLPDIDINKIIPDENKSISDGAIVPLGKYKNMFSFWIIEAICDKFKCSIQTPVSELPDAVMNIILYGCEEPIHLKNTPLGANPGYVVHFEGIINQLRNKQSEDDSNNKNNSDSEQYNTYKVCPVCNGLRLKKESLHFRISGRNIAQLAQMDVSDLYNWFLELPAQLNARQKSIASELIKEISIRLDFLLKVGLDYLSLDRPTKSLSGGETQRIRLATQIGSRLINVLYILDEPSIGLHHRDNLKLIDSLKELRNRGNSIIVVEHDKDMIMSADYIVDIGPAAGKNGGDIVFAGEPHEMLDSGSITAAYINGTKKIEIPSKRRKGNGKSLQIIGATGNNLKNIDISLPLGMIICVTGVSGSGKSSIIHETLFPVLSGHFYRSKTQALPCTEIKGIENIDKVIEVDQMPIGKTPRSNPSTYTGLFSDIRKLYESLPESKIRGYKLGRFSFNVKGGRCETCQGAGVKIIEMNFLPEVHVPCEVCNGKRYNRETLEVKFKGKSIADILDMTIDRAADFFENIPFIQHKLKMLQEVGLGYISLGQSSTTLSGGESQRIKLATELMKKDTGKTLYILDEPTTGLHFEDIRVLMHVLQKLADKGNTLIIIEHNMDVIKCADHIIDMGPEGGNKGGQIVAEGSPEEIALHKNSYTGYFLKSELL